MGAKVKPPKNPWIKIQPPKKSHAEIPSHKNFQNALNAIARKKETLVLNNLVPRALFPGFGGGAGKPGKSALGTRLSFETQKITCQIFATPKNPEIQSFKAKKILRPSLVSLEIRSTPLEHLPAGIFDCLPLRKNNNAASYKFPK